MTPILWILACGTDDPGEASKADAPTANPVDADGDGSPRSEDCNDDDAAIHPGATEACNGYDDNCDGAVDEGLFTAWFYDGDGDGWGDPALEAQGCTQPVDYVQQAGDCDDGNAAIHPDATEVCNTLDDDCDGAIDTEDDSLAGLAFYTDDDGDGYGTGPATWDCVAPSGMASLDGDCDDTDAAVHPAADELCDIDGVDEDCDDLTNADDPDLESIEHWPDTDSDGYGDAGSPPALQCLGLGGYAHNDWDCDDIDPSINPAIDEVCDDGIDNDCDDQVDVCGAIGDVFVASDAHFRIAGASDSQLVGLGWADAGDVDGDGNNDFWLGRYTDDTGAPKGGAAYLFLGPLAGEVTPEDRAALVYSSRDYAYLGKELIGLGDVDGDGYDDLLVSEHQSDASHIVAGPLSGLVDIDTAKLGTLAGSSFSGEQLDTIGDFDGDGLVDVIAGATLDGRAEIFLGPLTGTAGATTFLEEAFDGNDFGAAVAGVGDVDGDGLDDVLVGDPETSMSVDDHGAAYLFTGGKLGVWSAELSDAVIVGTTKDEMLGTAVASASDHNGDGYADLAVGTPNGDDPSEQNTGAAYVFFGPVSGMLLQDDANVVLYGQASGDAFGASLDGDGDVDRDTDPDLVVSAGGAEDVGAAYVFVGPLTGTHTAADAHARVLTDSALNWLPQMDVKMLPDHDGDGRSEVGIGMPYASVEGHTLNGAVWVLDGSVF